MKTHKTKLALIILLLAVAIALAVYSTEVMESIYALLAPEENTEKFNENSQLKQQPKTQTQPNKINQLLQKTPASAPGNAPADSDITADDIETLQEALNDFYTSEDEQDRESALMTIGEYSDPKAKEAILYALNDPEDNVREQAVSQIGNWEDEKERHQMLLTAISNDKPEIVVLAIDSITEYDDPALIQKIKELSNDKNEDIRESAKTALELADLD